MATTWSVGPCPGWSSPCSTRAKLASCGVMRRWRVVLGILISTTTPGSRGPSLALGDSPQAPRWTAKCRQTC
eukprot:4436192-Prymnesium_polylepis.1